MFIEIFSYIILFIAVQVDRFFSEDYFTSSLVDIIVSLYGPHIHLSNSFGIADLKIKAVASIVCFLIFSWSESSFKHAICRNLAKIITVCTLGIGYFLIFFSNKTLHDKICGTVVILDDYLKN